ncbi:hypothetical protein [Riemerella columbina]|uniref:hypothetical protein n=1 Tax=Riemerella columbina TaxID=103810 RepID=UPI0003782C5D|nr:hypothetical protein [Riemerella columbina]
MNKALKTYGVLLVIVLVVLSILELNKSKMIDWSLNYNIEKKSPFGLYIFDKEVDSLLGEQLIRTDENPYTYLEKDSLHTPKNYFSLEKNFTDEGINYLLNEVDKGSTAMMFFSSNQFYQKLTDSLGVNLDTDYGIKYDENLHFYFTDKALASDKILLSESHNNYYFTSFNKEANIQILGYIKDEVGHKKKAVFIKVNYGKGAFYLCTQPILLTNYYLKEKENQKAIEGLFSYLPKRKTVWFQNNLSKQSTSEMRFILSNPSLRSAWYLILVGLLLFLFFHAKRRQRIVPIIVPKKNKSVEFVKNIGNLYLQEGNPQDMAEKKITYFLNKVRNELYITTDLSDEDFVRRLQQKTGKDTETIEKAVQRMRLIRARKVRITETQLIELNQLLDNIYQ